MTYKLEPKPGFDWGRLEWAGPNELPPERCGYCGAAMPDDDEEPGSVPLMLWDADGAMVKFCDDCSERWFGFTHAS